MLSMKLGEGKLYFNLNAVINWDSHRNESMEGLVKSLEAV